MATKRKDSKETGIVVRDIARERVAIYGRVSSEEQKEAGTINNQTDFAQRYCDLHQLPVFDFYKDDGVSGTLPFEARPEGARLLKDAEARKFGTVLVWRIDRVVRGSLRILLDVHDRLNAAGVALRSMTEPFDTGTPIGMFVMTLLGSIAQLERATILERTMLGRLRAARDGRWLGGPAPYGYRVEGPDKNRRLVVEDAEAQVVRRIFKLYVDEGMGLIPVANLLNAEGVPSPFEHRGKKTTRWPERERKWNTGTLSRILRCTAYAGTYQAGQRVGKEIADYETPVIMERATFDKAQRFLRERFVEASRNARRFYLLRGLIRCHCGQTVVGDGHKQAGYYACRQAGHFRQRAEVLEEAIWQGVTAFARNPQEEVLADLREKLRGEAREAEGTASELAEVARQIVAKKGEQDNVITWCRKGRITEEQMGAQLDALDAEIATLEARQQALFARQAQVQAQEMALLSAQGMLARLRERVDQIERDAASDEPERREAALRDKRDLFKALVAGIAVGEDGTPAVTYRFSDSSLHSLTCR